jgi:DNA topoisomerase-3
MIRLIVTARARVAEAIAAALGPPRTNRKLWIECGSTVVVWCGPRILVDLEPEEYDSRWKKWALEQLPMLPAQWRVKPSEVRQLNAIRGLLDRATSVIHAGCPDRQGQYTVDEVFCYLAYPGKVERALLTDLNPAAILRSLERLEPNEKFLGQADAVRGQRRADCLVGWNLTRYATLLGREAKVAKPNDVFSAGRVRTPCLQMLARRDLEIDSFKPATTFALQVEFTLQRQAASPKRAPQTLDVGSFPAYLTRAAAGPESSSTPAARLEDGEEAQRLRRLVTDKPGRLVALQAFDTAEPPPALFTLPSLQVEASRLFGLSAKETLDVALNLFEVHHAITFPGSECSSWPCLDPSSDGAPDAHGAIGEALRANCPVLAGVVALADFSRQPPQSPAVVPRDQLHHGILPTAAEVDREAMTAHEVAIYGLIGRRYLAHFFGDHKFGEVVALLELDDGLRFVARAREVVEVGWRVVDPPALVPDRGDETAALLKDLRPGAHVVVRDARVLRRLSQPPPRFTDGTLIEAMNSVVAHITDPHLRAQLAAASSEPIRLGTPATQAEIIEDLCRREFVVRTEQGLVATPLGKRVLSLLPTSVAAPDAAAVWELALQRVAHRELPLHQFLDNVAEQLVDLLSPRAKPAPGQLTLIPPAPGVPCPACQQGTLRERVSQFGSFLGCSRYPSCRHTVQLAAVATKPSAQAPAAIPPAEQRH